MNVSNPILTMLHKRMRNLFKQKDLDRVKVWADILQNQDNLWKKVLSNSAGKKILIATSTGELKYIFFFVINFLPPVYKQQPLHLIL